MQGWRSKKREDNINAAINIMIKQNINIFAVQETWLDRNEHIEVIDTISTAGNYSRT